MTLPNFLIIGAAKSGTTALYRYLYDHPEIFMSEWKELHYFSFPETRILNKGPKTYKRISVSTLKEYEEYFQYAKNAVAIGEVSPSYLYLPGTANRIFKLLPNIKLIAILRNPVERAFSAFMHARRDGWEEITDFRKALEQEETRIEAKWEIAWHYKQMGYYNEQLKRYYDLFPHSNIRVFLYDDLILNSNILFINIFQFLNVNNSFSPNISVQPNKSGVIRSRVIYNVMNSIFLTPNPLKYFARLLLPEALRWRFTTRLRNLNINKYPFPEDARNYLLSFFTDDICRLEDLINRDLSNWKNIK